jgi:hypothetical protein
MSTLDRLGAGHCRCSSHCGVLALIRINENPNLKAKVQKTARMEKNKKKHQPKLVYYRLLQGVKNLFTGVKRLFLFRWKQRVRMALLKACPSMLSFLDDPTVLAYEMEHGLWISLCFVEERDGRWSIHACFLHRRLQFRRLGEFLSVCQRIPLKNEG